MADGNFTGAKIALIHNGRVLTYLRDDRADIPFPAHWDLPGGGRENGEDPDQCALRELFEEFGLRLDPSRIAWRRAYESWSQPGMISHFMGAEIGAADIAAIKFGNEGQHWEMMPVEAYLAHDRAVPHFKVRLRDFLDATRAIALEAEEGL